MDQKTLERLRKKEEYLKNIEKRYLGFSEREWDIIRAGWGACETRIGLERLEDSSEEKKDIAT